MVRVWISGGWEWCTSLGYLLEAGGVRTHCSPGPAAGLAADTYAELEIGRAREHLGGLDALVYLADRQAQEPVVAAVMQAAGGFLACAREAVRLMASQGVAGNLVCVCDIAGVAGRAGRSSAACASGALLGMVRGLAKELGRQEISVNALACGPMADVGTDEDRLSEAEAKLFAVMGLGQPLAPWELAATLGLLVRGGHGMTGQVLHLDHGLVI